MVGQGGVCIVLKQAVLPTNLNGLKLGIARCELPLRCAAVLNAWLGSFTMTFQTEGPGAENRPGTCCTCSGSPWLESGADASVLRNSVSYLLVRTDIILSVYTGHSFRYLCLLYMQKM